MLVSTELSGVVSCSIVMHTGDLPMSAGRAMAKKPASVRKPGPDEMVTRALRMRQEYADWLDRFASKERVNLASLIDRALATHAERAGFQAPPDRVP
jgi:hypothetical protein